MEKRKHGKLFFCALQNLEIFFHKLCNISKFFISIHLPTTSSYQNSSKLLALFILMRYRYDVPRQKLSSGGVLQK